MGEYLQIVSNVFDEGASYSFAVIERLKDTANLMSYLGQSAEETTVGAEGVIDAGLDRYLEEQKVVKHKREDIKESIRSVYISAAYDKTVDYITKTTNIFNQLKKVWDKNAEPYKAEATYVKKLQRIYADRTRKLSDIRADKAFNPIGEMYEELENLFWAGTNEEKNRVYEAAAMMITHNLLHANPAGENDRSAMNRAIKDIERKILTTSPTNFVGKEKGKRSASSYQTFLHALGEEDRNRVIAAQKDWETRKRIWDDAIKKTKHQLLSFGYRKWREKTPDKRIGKVADPKHPPTIYEKEFYEQGLDVPMFLEGVEQE